MSSFKVQIVSVPDREKLVAEIWHIDILLAELNQEKENLEIIFYFKSNITFDLNEFLETIEIAKKYLLNE